MNLSLSRSLFPAFLCVAFVACTAGIAVAQTPTLDSEQLAFLGLINNYRAQNGAGALQVSVALQNSSQWMSGDMAAKNYFSHTDSLGRNPFVRMAAFGYTYSFAGENIAAGNSDAQSTFNQWLTACDADSSGNCTYAHRENMRNPGYKVIGIGRIFNGGALYRWYWTTDFGGLLDQTINTGYTPPPATPPTADWVTPASGSGTTQNFTFQYASASGNANLNTVHALFNTSVSGSNACYVYYTVASNALFLMNDAGSGATAGGIAPGSGTTLQNTQCSINVASTTVSKSGSVLQLTVPVTFKTGGAESIYGYALDNANLNSGWKTLGSWTSTVTVNKPPTADSATPASGSGSTSNFTFKYSSNSGFANLNAVYALINTSLTANNGCWVFYVRAANALYLVNDAGTTATASPVAPGTAATLQNSQCSVDVSRASASGSGNTLSLILPITFKTNATQTMYGYSADNAGLNSGWQVVGQWQSTGGAVNSAPTVDSMTPNAGVGATQTFTMKFSSASGYTNLSAVYVLFNSVLGAATGCWAYYVPGSSSLNLINDAGTASVSGGLIPGSAAILQNTQCSIDVSKSSAVASGNTLTLTLAVTFKPTVLLTQTVYGYALDNRGLNSGWQTMGTWKRQ